MIIKTIYQKDITILSLNIPSSMTSELTELKGETDDYTSILGHFNIPYLIIDKLLK